MNPRSILAMSLLSIVIVAGAGCQSGDESRDPSSEQTSALYCPEGEACTAVCEDGVCDSDYGEDAYTCGYDCAVCGDGYCSSNESVFDCEVDCQGYCGDGYCSANWNEDSYNCSDDCGQPNNQGYDYCGDRSCTRWETSLNCPQDCFCGDGTCDYDENTCFADCGWCDAGTFECNGVCIPDGSCCADSDCAIGAGMDASCARPVCSAEHICELALDEGARCGAGNLCTQQCEGGFCVDIAVRCTNIDCNVTSCNPATGSCEHIAVSDGTSCGGNGCHEVGVCSQGTCEGKRTMDCAQATTVCSVGLCDSEDGACVEEPAMNGTRCGGDAAPEAACFAGKCLGACVPTSPCVEVFLDPWTGRCQESPIAAGTACSGECTVAGQCDGQGACVGRPMPDGAACHLRDDVGQCSDGACISNAQASDDSADAPADRAQEEARLVGGCQLGGGGLRDGGWLIAAALWLVAHRRTRVRIGRAVH